MGLLLSFGDEGCAIGGYGLSLGGEGNGIQKRRAYDEIKRLKDQGEAAEEEELGSVHHVDQVVVYILFRYSGCTISKFILSFQSMIEEY